jgi:hypothetical protein
MVQNLGQMSAHVVKMRLIFLSMEVQPGKIESPAENQQSLAN